VLLSTSESANPRGTLPRFANRTRADNAVYPEKNSEKTGSAAESGDFENVNNE
jgi:hypothetical protein